MASLPFIWPTPEDYDLAMRDRAETVRDDDIRNGQLSEDHLGIRRYGGANLYVITYRVGQWMVRCFCSNRSTGRRPPSDIRERYQEISRFSQSHLAQVSALLPVYYIAQGIEVDYIDYSCNEIVDTQVLPLVKMPFLKSLPLGTFIALHYEDSRIMKQLCSAWLRMINEMEDAQFAHGDLDLTNVFVDEQNNALTLKLIDYDNTWLPSLQARQQTEYGHPSFQHPAFQYPNKRPYDVTMDRFSALVMYISLQALATYPHLYQQWGADEADRLIFAKTDFEAETRLSGADYETGRIAQLSAMNIEDLDPYLEELSDSLHNRCQPRPLREIAIQTPKPPTIFLWNTLEYVQPTQHVASAVTPPPNEVLQNISVSSLPTQQIAPIPPSELLRLPSVTLHSDVTEHNPVYSPIAPQASTPDPENDMPTMPSLRTRLQNDSHNSTPQFEVTGPIRPMRRDVSIPRPLLILLILVVLAALTLIIWLLFFAHQATPQSGSLALPILRRQFLLVHNLSSHLSSSMVSY